jgi:hypothetical protein
LKKNRRVPRDEDDGDDDANHGERDVEERHGPDRADGGVTARYSIGLKTICTYLLEAGS